MDNCNCQWCSNRWGAKISKCKIAWISVHLNGRNQVHVKTSSVRVDLKSVLYLPCCLLEWRARILQLTPVQYQVPWTCRPSSTRAIQSQVIYTSAVFHPWPKLLLENRKIYSPVIKMFNPYNTVSIFCVQSSLGIKQFIGVRAIQGLYIVKRTRDLRDYSTREGY